jgi:hypothetical protein
MRHRLDDVGISVLRASTSKLRLGTRGEDRLGSGYGVALSLITFGR